MPWTSRSNGSAAHLDLSATEVTIATGPVLEVGGVLLNTGGVGGAKRYGAPASFYACTDGQVRISAMEDHQWRGVVAAMGSPAWAERFATVDARIGAADQVDEHVAAWTRTRTKEDAETLLQSHGVPATAVYSPEEILRSPQLAHRDAFEPLPARPGRDARVVGVPFRAVSSGDDRRRHALRGLRVLEASRVLAVPLAGSLLGALGADVVKIEDLPRLDMYRRRGPYIDGEAGMERSAYFALMNHSKRSAAFDVDAHRERLDAMVADTDVVLENLGPKRALALNVAASVAPAEHPHLLAVSSSGFGQDGPQASYRAYAYNLQASCALGYLTRTEAGDSAEIDIAWADLIAAYSLATIIAAWAVGPAGNAGVGLDFAMADLVISHFNEFVAAASLDPTISRLTRPTSSHRTRRTACTRRTTAGSRCRSTGPSSGRGSRRCSGATQPTMRASRSPRARTRPPTSRPRCRAGGRARREGGHAERPARERAARRARVLHARRAPRVGGAAPGRCSVAAVRRISDRAGSAPAAWSRWTAQEGTDRWLRGHAAIHRVDSRLSEFPIGKEHSP